MEQMPLEIRRGNAEEVENFLIDGWLFSLFNKQMTVTTTNIKV